MKTFVLSGLLLAAFTFSSAQSIYSLKGVDGINGIQFQGIVNLNNQQTIFDTQTDYSAYKNGVRNIALDAPNSKLMASLAYDSNTGKVIFMPMISSYVYIQDVKSNELTSIDAIKEIHVAACDQGSQFSRMTMAPDGNAYALNNDFTELIQINPRTQSVQNLGTVKMDAGDPNEDKGFWGGDMIADSQNNLYVISASGNLFQLNIDERSATSLGKLQGLPNNYTTNGAAVLQDGNIVLGNARGGAMYQFNLDDLQVRKYKDNSSACYDLASQFFVPIAEEYMVEDNVNGLQIYPTIVSDKEFNLKSNADLGRVTVRVYDLNSNVVAEYNAKNLNAKADNNYTLSNLRPNIYIVKAFDQNGTEILNQKVTVVR